MEPIISSLVPQAAQPSGFSPAPAFNPVACSYPASFPSPPEPDSPCTCFWWRGIGQRGKTVLGLSGVTHSEWCPEHGEEVRRKDIQKIVEKAPEGPWLAVWVPEDIWQSLRGYKSWKRMTWHHEPLEGNVRLVLLAILTPLTLYKGTRVLGYRGHFLDCLELDDNRHLLRAVLHKELEKRDPTNRRRATLYPSPVPPGLDWYVATPSRTDLPTTLSAYGFKPIHVATDVWLAKEPSLTESVILRANLIVDVRSAVVYLPDDSGIFGPGPPQDPLPLTLQPAYRTNWSSYG